MDNTRNYPGYQLSADAEGCQDLRARLGKIRSSVAFSLTPPDAGVLSVPNNQGGRARHFAGLMFQVQTSSYLCPNTFRWEEQGAKFILTCSQEKIVQFLAGVAGIERGKGDYSIRGEGGQELWFWWQLRRSNEHEGSQQAMRGKLRQRP